MIDKLKIWDEELFLWLNSHHTAWFDPIAYYASETLTWVPLYVFLIYIIYKHDPKNSWWIFGGAALTILLADQITSGLMKPYFERLRPCHDERWEGMVYIYERCGGLYGFASSHAANTFGIAVYLNLKLKGKFKYLPWMLLWAAFVSYTRIYLGVHYPLDILVGGLVGVLTACFSWIFVVFIRREILKILLKT